MTKLDDIFKAKLSKDSIKELNLEMSWNDFSKNKKKQKTNTYKTIASVALILLLSIIAYFFLCKKNKIINEPSQKGTFQPVRSLNSIDCTKTHLSDLKAHSQTPTTNFPNIKTDDLSVKQKATTFKENLEIEYDALTMSSRDDEMKNISRMDSSNIDEEKKKEKAEIEVEEIKKPVIIVKTKTVSIQKTDTIVNLEEKKRKRNSP